ncbi:MAG: hypothetical protein ACOCUD_04105 [Bacillota bacterium]
MIKYKLKDTPLKPFSFNYLKEYLESVGVEQVESFIRKPAKEDEESYELLDNIDEAVTALYNNFKANKKFFVQVDSDVDGYTSSAIFIGFFKRLFPDVEID